MAIVSQYIHLLSELVNVILEKLYLERVEASLAAEFHVLSMVEEALRRGHLEVSLEIQEKVAPCHQIEGRYTHTR